MALQYWLQCIVQSLSREDAMPGTLFCPISTPEEPLVLSVNSILIIGTFFHYKNEIFHYAKVLWMLKVLHGTTKYKKEPSF